MDESILEYFEKNKMQYIRDICDLVGEKFFDQLLQCNPQFELKKKKKKKTEKKKIEKKIYGKCQALTQCGKQCSRNIYEQDKTYCGLHYKQPFGNTELGHVKKQKNTFVQN